MKEVAKYSLVLLTVFVMSGCGMFMPLHGTNISGTWLPQEFIIYWPGSSTEMKLQCQLPDNTWHTFASGYTAASGSTVPGDIVSGVNNLYRLSLTAAVPADYPSACWKAAVDITKGRYQAQVHAVTKVNDTAIMTFTAASQNCVAGNDSNHVFTDTGNINWINRVSECSMENNSADERPADERYFVTLYANYDSSLAFTPTLYVSPTGTGYECTQNASCSLTRARERVRLTNTDASMTSDQTIYLRGGTYALDSTFALDSSDSGKNGYTVQYVAYPGETPILSGGKSISNWSLYNAGLGIYRAPAPGNLGNPRQLYVNGVRAQRARTSLKPAGFTKTATGYSVTGAMAAKMAALTNQQDVEVVSLVKYLDYRCSMAGISTNGTTITMDETCWNMSQSQDRGAAQMKLPMWIENAYELLDNPGEWYHDRSAGFIYYIPRAGENLSTAEVIMPAHQDILKITGTYESPAKFIALRGLTFAYGSWIGPEETVEIDGVMKKLGYAGGGGGIRITPLTGYGPVYFMTPAAVTLSTVENVTVEQCAFTHMGAGALRVELGAKNSSVIGNHFEDISSNGIVLGEVDPWTLKTTDERYITENLWIHNNFIEGIGREYFDTVGIIAGCIRGSDIGNNEIRNVPYSGIAWGGAWGYDDTVVCRNNSIAGNLVAYGMQRLNDGGLIYTVGSTHQPTSRIHHNFLHNQMHNYGAIVTIQHPAL